MEVQSVCHLFLHCSFVASIQGKIIKLWNIPWVFPSSIEDFFSQWKAPTKNPMLRYFWDLIFPHVAWDLQKEHNIIYRGKEAAEDIVFDKIVRFLNENFNTLVQKNILSLKVEQSLYDLTVAKEWNINMAPSRTSMTAKKDREGICWSFPPNDWIKANFDGAAKGNPGVAGCGGVIRDSFGNFIGATTSPLGSQTNHLAEAAGAFHIINLAQSLNIKHLWLEGDSKNIIDYLKEKSPPSSTIKSWIEEAKLTLAKFEKVKISHAYRESNAVVNFFSNEGVKSKEVRTWLNTNDLNSNVCALINYDKSHGKATCYPFKEDI